MPNPEDEDDGIPLVAARLESPKRKERTISQQEKWRSVRRDEVGIQLQSVGVPRMRLEDSVARAVESGLPHAINNNDPTRARFPNRRVPGGDVQGQ